MLIAMIWTTLVRGAASSLPDAAVRGGSGGKKSGCPSEPGAGTTVPFCSASTSSKSSLRDSSLSSVTSSRSATQASSFLRWFFMFSKRPGASWPSLRSCDTKLLMSGGIVFQPIVKRTA